MREVEEIVRIFTTRDAYYWATHSGAELDLLILTAGKRYGFEIKHSDAPKITRSMRVALQADSYGTRLALVLGNEAHGARLARFNSSRKTLRASRRVRNTAPSGGRVSSTDHGLPWCGRSPASSVVSRSPGFTCSLPP